MHRASLSYKKDTIGFVRHPVGLAGAFYRGLRRKMCRRGLSSSAVVVSRRTGVALLLLMLAVPASASAVDPQQTVGGAGSQWTSGDLLTQTGENCSVLGSPYTEPMVSGIASYGGTTGVPVVGQRYYTAFLISVPGNPCGPGSSAIETDVVLPPHTTIDTTAPIRCFGEPRGATTFGELTGANWSFNGSSGPYCPTQAVPSALHSGGWSLGFRPLASGQLFEIFVPVISTLPLIGAQASPADGFRWLTDSTGVYANPGLSTVWANVFASSTGTTPSIYFTRPAATPFWKADAPAGQQNRVELFANLYTAGIAGNLCFKIIRVSDGSTRWDSCTNPGWTSAVPGGQPDLFRVVPLSADVTGPNGGYAPVSFDGPPAVLPALEWDQDMKIVWTYTYSGGSATGDALFHTLPGPDTDGDGVPDISDACPLVKGTLANGCLPAVQTDPDGDGVFGAADLCPTVNGLGSLNGCPGGVVPPPGTTSTTTTTTTTTTPPVVSPPRTTHHRPSTSRAGGRVIVDTGLSVTCPSRGSACSIVLTATVAGPQSRAAAGMASRPKAVLVGTLRTSVPAGKTLVVRLPLNPKGAALLKKHHRLKLVLAGTARAGSGPATLLSSTITIVNPPVRKQKHR